MCVEQSGMHGANALIQFFRLLLVTAWLSCWSGAHWTSSAKSQIKGIKLVQYLTTAAHSGERRTCQQASLTCKWSPRPCVWGGVRCYSCHTGNPMDTYRVHRTCGSWPTYTHVRQATEREREQKGKVGNENGERKCWDEYKSSKLSTHTHWHANDGLKGEDSRVGSTAGQLENPQSAILAHM